MRVRVCVNIIQPSRRIKLCYLSKLSGTRDQCAMCEINQTHKGMYQVFALLVKLRREEDMEVGGNV